MKAQDKLTLFNLLKTASGAINGFTPASFSKVPDFYDDVEINKNLPNLPNQSNLPNSTETSVQNTTGKITLSDITSKIEHCTRCELARTRNSVVPGMGVEHPDVLVIGEGPGHDEDMQGKPFVGKAGALLDKMLNAIQLDRNTNCYIANVVKCRPPQNRDPFPEEQAACFSFLEAQIRLLSPKMILCMGKISGNKLLKTEGSLHQIRGKFYDYNGIPLMVTYHPSALLHNAELKRPAWEDLKLFKQKLDSLS